MASVRKRSWTTSKGAAREKWIVDYTDELGRRRSGGSFKRKKDADAKKRQIEDDIERGIHVAPREALTFAEVAKLWLEDCDRLHRVGGKPGSVRIRQLHSHTRKHLLPYFGKLKVNKITSDIVQDWVNEKLEEICEKTDLPYKIKTIKHILGELRLALDFAIAKKHGLKRNPVKDAPPSLPDREEEPIKFLEAEDVAKLLRWAMISIRRGSIPTTTWRSAKLAVLIAMFSGMRRGEISALDWKRVRVDAWEIDAHYTRSRHDGTRPTTKIGHRGRRTIPMNPILHAVLDDYWKRCGRPAAGPVLLNAFGEVVEPESITSTVWPMACKGAGLIDADGRRMYRFHDVRHAAGSLWLADGMPLEEVSRLLGHQSINTTWNIYMHKLRHDERALRAIDAVSVRFARLMQATGLQLPASERPAQLEGPMIDVTPANGEAANGGDPVAAAPEAPPAALEEWQRRSIELFKDGMTIKRTAAAVHKEKLTVSLWLLAAGLRTQPPRTGWGKFTKDQIDCALSMWGKEPIDDICRTVGASRTTVYQWAEKAGLKSKPQVSRLSGIPRPSYTPEERARAVAMRREGRSRLEIGASQHSIGRWFRKANATGNATGLTDAPSSADAD